MKLGHLPLLIILSLSGPGWAQSSLSPKHDLWLEYSSDQAKPNTSKENLVTQVQEINRSLATGLIPAVVNIYTTTKIQFQGGLYGPRGGQNDLFQYFFDEMFRNYPGFLPPQEKEYSSLGSGFIIHPDGYVITNAHVIEKADKIKVKLDDDKYNKQFEFDAEVMGADPLSDIALLKFKPSAKLQVAPLGDSDKLRVGDYVMAVGNPFGHGHTVTQGIVSALGRELEELTPFSSFIQTDASINPGNSGGPLVNIHGEVVGINTAIDARGAGIGFALPINKAKKILADLKSKGKVSRGWIGILIGPEIDDKWKKYFNVDRGIIISDIVPGQPAEKSGILKNDVITDFNNKPVRSSRDIINYVAEVPIGKTVPVKIFRGGKHLSLNITVAERSPSEEMAVAPQFRKPSDPETGSPALAKLGLALTPLTQEIREKFGISEDIRGVMVAQVGWNSPAHRAGLMEGDVIEKVNGKDTPSVGDFSQQLKGKEKTFLFNVIRRGRSIPVLVEIE
jgi:serine protease Do